MTAPEFSRPIRIDTVGIEPRTIEVEAGEEERAALARRFALVGIGRLAATVEVARRDDEIIARGRISAEAVQSCVASGEPVDARVDEPFELMFRPLPPIVRPDDEVELSETELDMTFYEGGAIDLGEAVAETLALSLDPYPRAPDSDNTLKAAGVKTEAEAGPFGALAGLRDKLKP
ncbi:MAG: YceD family protein [Allosphingosinicella sp.]